ncbi:hypothetical protein ACWZJV_14995 [Nocardioides sp. WG-D5]
MSSVNVETIKPSAPQWSLDTAKGLERDSGRRKEIPVRRSFVRGDDGDPSPMARLVSRGGRGGEVPLKLYLALIWRCSAKPFQTSILARNWATLLGLDDPNGLGARRVTNALKVLERERLVQLQPRRGDSTIITLLNESGRGERYSLPSTAAARAPGEQQLAANLYFKIPLELWTEGYIQSMSTAAVAMLLVLLDSRNIDGRRTWWSTTRFPELFSLSTSIRTKGTTELINFGLLSVRKELVADTPQFSFGRDRVRNTYALRGAARPEDMREKEKPKKAAAGGRKRLTRPSEVTGRRATTTVSGRRVVPVSGRRVVPASDTADEESTTSGPDPF